LLNCITKFNENTKVSTKFTTKKHAKVKFTYLETGY
jgi:hypothetical protein